MTQKFIYVNNDGDYEESPGAFEQSDFINTSTGVTDAGKPIVLDSNGQIDSSMLPTITTDHGALTGLLDDDHTQYIRVDGTRAFTGDQSIGNFKLTNLADGVADQDAVNVRQLQNAINGLDWKNSARVATTGNITISSAPASIDGVTLVNGDRILVKDQTDLTENGIYVFNGAGSSLTRSLDADQDSEVTANLTIAVEEGTLNEDFIYMITSNDPLTIGTSDIVFSQLSVNTLVGGNGISISGNTIAADLLASGGLKFVGGQVAVEPADFAGNGLIDDGADNLAIDFATTFTIDAADTKAIEASKIASTTNGEGASIIGVNDASGYYSGTDLESVLNEIESQVGGLTSSTFNFTEDNVLADNDNIYTALDKLDLKWGDLASNATGEGASLVGIEDVAGNFTGSTVEAALTELFTLASQKDDQDCATAGATIAAGDLLYFSANDTVSPMPITSGNRAVGIAITAATTGNEVCYVRWDETVLGVLSGATAGDRYYWNGTTLTTTIPSGPGQFVWQVGIAKNATDLLATVEFVKKNA